MIENKDNDRVELPIHREFDFDYKRGIMIYFDNSATTRPSAKVIEAMTNNLNSELYGNPGSLHKLGVEADRRLADVTLNTAKLLGADKDEIYFSSCGTEGSNTLIKGFAHKYAKRLGKTIISTRTEHKATLEVLKSLEDEGFNVLYVPVGRDGKPDLMKLSEMITDDTMLFCFTHVNNETGALLPLPEIVDIRNRLAPDAKIFIDFVQSLGKLPIDLHKSGADMATFSGHKIHGIKGVGVNYLNKNIRIDPLILGGGQQNGMRSGTQSLILAESFMVALDEISSKREENYKTVSSINKYLREELTKRGHKILSPDDALPYVLNVSFDGFESETMLHSLEIYDIYVSTISACSSKTKKVSYVLLETGVDRKTAANAVRLSFSGYNTQSEAEEFIRCVDEIYDRFSLKR